jgi:hypothetical protein
MEARDFVRQISQVWDLFRSELQIGKLLVCPASLKVDEIFRDVALSDDSSYEEVCSVTLGPLVFALVIAKMYYPEAWAGRSEFWNATGAPCLDARLLKELGEAFAVADFSLNEKKSLHFGKYIAAAASPGKERRR